MKKTIVIALLLLNAIFICMPSKTATAAESNVEEKISQETKNQIELLEIDEIEQALDDIGENEFTNNLSASDLIESIVDGKFTLSFQSIIEFSTKTIANSFLKVLPYICTILGIILLSSMINKLKSQNFSSGVSEIVFFATYTIMILVVSALVSIRIAECSNIISKINNQMSAVFPVLLTLMTSAGASASVKMYQPAVVALSGFVSTVFAYFLLPIVSVLFVVTIVSNLSDNVKLTKFEDFLSSIFKWSLGLVSTLFMAFLAIRGISSATKDGVSIRTAKYAIKNYVPIIGGYISEGFELVMVSSILIKNGVGILAMLLLFVTVLSPIVSIVVMSLSFKLVTAVTEPIADKKFCAFLSSVGKILSLLCVVVIGVALMYFLSLALMIATANNIF